MFALLFYVERRYILRETQRLITELTGTADDLAALVSADASDEDIVEHYSGPVAAAFDWLRALFAEDFGQVWRLSDPLWRLARAQSWLWNNRGLLGMSQTQLEEVAVALAEEDPTTHWLWADFSRLELDGFLQAWEDFRHANLGAASSPRRTGPGYDLVVLTSLGRRRHGYMVHGPTLLQGALSLLMHESDGDWRMASHISVAPPRPGWPPAWWVYGGDPTADQIAKDRRGDG